VGWAGPRYLEGDHMNTRIAATFLVLTQLAGCIVVSDKPGDITFHWSMEEYSCAETPDVRKVRVTIPGEVLENNGIYDCENGAGFNGITLHNFRGGVYSYTIEALDAFNRPLYWATGTLEVDGNVDENVVLGWDGSTYAYVSWTDIDCTNIDRVYLVIDGYVPAAGDFFDCADGAFGVATPRVEPGSHTIDIWAKNYDASSAGDTLYAAGGTFTTVSGQTPAYSYSMTEMGIVDLQFRFNGSTVCGGSFLYVNFRNLDTGYDVFPTAERHDCTAGPLSWSLYPGHYEVSVTGSNGYTMLDYVDLAVDPGFYGVVTIRLGN
jgi:hypothetical protein